MDAQACFSGGTGRFCWSCGGVFGAFWRQHDCGAGGAVVSAVAVRGSLERGFFLAWRLRPFGSSYAFIGSVLAVLCPPQSFPVDFEA